MVVKIIYYMACTKHFVALRAACMTLYTIHYVLCSTMYRTFSSDCFICIWENWRLRKTSLLFKHSCEFLFKWRQEILISNLHWGYVDRTSTVFAFKARTCQLHSRRGLGLGCINEKLEHQNDSFTTQWDNNIRVLQTLTFMIEQRAEKIEFSPNGGRCA